MYGGLYFYYLIKNLIKFDLMIKSVFLTNSHSHIPTSYFHFLYPNRFTICSFPLLHPALPFPSLTRIDPLTLHIIQPYT